MIGGEIANLTDELASLSEQLDTADFIFENILMLLNLRKHRSICLSQDVDAQLGGPSRLGKEM